MNLVFLFMRLPFWVYFVLAAGIGYMAETTYQSKLGQESEYEIALQQEPPALVNLASFTKGTNRSPVNEVHVEGWINTDYNYTLIEKKNLIETGRRHMYLLFGKNDTKATRTVRAAMVLTTSQKDQFVADIDKYMSSIADNPTGFNMVFNGFGESSTGFSSLAYDAMKDENLTRATNFIFIRPFFNGREAALTPHGVPIATRVNGWLIALAVALIGVGKFVFKRGLKARAKAPAQVSTPSWTPARQPAPLADSVADDSPLGKLIRAESAKGQAEGEVEPEWSLADRMAASKQKVPAKKKEFPVKQIAIGAIVLGLVYNPSGALTFMPILLIAGFWVLVLGGAKKIQAVLNMVFNKETPKAAVNPTIPLVGEAPNDVKPMMRNLGFKTAVKASTPKKPAQKGSYADSPIKSASGGLFKRKAKADRFDPFDKLAAERKLI